jgi:hypothetical protein
MHSVVELPTVLANLASGKASWRALYPPRSGFEGGGVRSSSLVVVCTLTRGCGWRETVRCTAAGVAASCRPVVPQRRGWCCSARDGVVVEGMAAQGRWWQRGCASLVRRHGIVLGGRESGVHPLFEGSAVLFRGCGARVVQVWVAQCHGADTGLTTQCRTVAGMASPGGLAEQRRDMIPRRCQKDGMARIRLWLGSLHVSEH